MIGLRSTARGRRTARAPCTAACRRCASRPEMPAVAPARPKSVILARPRPSIMTLAGFRSRCSTPSSCAAASPAHSCRAISTALSSGSRPMRRSSDARSSPSTYSIERKWRRSAVVADRRTRGRRWDASRAATAALRSRNRSSRSGSCSTVARQELQRDRLAELQVVGAIDLAHAAAAEQADHAVAAGEHDTRKVAPAIAGRARRLRRRVRIGGWGSRDDGAGIHRDAAVAAEGLRSGLGLAAGRAGGHGEGVYKAFVAGFRPQTASRGSRVESAVSAWESLTSFAPKSNAKGCDPMRCGAAVSFLFLRSSSSSRMHTMSQPPPGSLGAPFVGEALTFLKDPFTFTLSRTRQHGHIWKTRILSDTVVFFAGPQAFSFFMDADNFTRQNGSPKFLQELLHPDAVPFLDGDRHKTRKRLLLTAFTDQAMESYLPGMFTVIQRFVDKWVGEGEKPVAGDLSQLGFDIADVLFAASDPATSNVESAKRLHDHEQGCVRTADQPAVHRVRQGDPGARSPAGLSQEADCEGRQGLRARRAQGRAWTQWRAALDDRARDRAAPLLLRGPRWSDGALRVDPHRARRAS